MPYQAFRFHVMWRRCDEAEFQDFFQTNDLQEAKEFAMRLAFEEGNVVYVRDEQRSEIVRNFDAANDQK